VLAGLLPPRASRVLDGIEPYGFVIVVILMMTGVLWAILNPLRFYFTDIFWAIAGFG
jgi:hypothetical protein